MTTAYVNVRLSFLHFGIMFSCIECIHFGLIRPIEVVEEFGCHDTELRLTCGNLDSKLAILEATFTPNCTHDECLRFNMKRLVRTFGSEEKEESKNAEKEAGQKFLDTLRNSHPKEEDVDEDILDNKDEKELVHNINGQNRKRTSLRLVLERLIIRYLRRISPEDELYAESFPRSRRNTLIEDGYAQLVLNETENIEEIKDRHEEEDSIRIQSARQHCDEQRRQISSLNRLDLEKSYMNQSDYEYNIRRVLNKRCSGKNHCSFIFTIDHPFAKVWDGGVVRVKYICMDDFRTNRYCGEHLPIGFEIDPNIQVLENDKGEPKAESRIQPRETSLHSLKIIKAHGSIGPGNIRNQSMAVQDPQTIKIDGSFRQRDHVTEGHKNRVYSQDFRVLKILPSNIDDFNEVDRIGDEIFFRNEEESELNEQSMKDSQYEVTPAHRNAFENKTLKEEGVHKEIENNSKILDNITLTIREGGHYINVYPSASIPVNLAVNDNMMKNEDSTMMTVPQELVISTTANKRSELEAEKDVPLDYTTENSVKGDYLSEAKQNNSEGINEQPGNGLREMDLVKLDQTRITYNSIQRTSYRSPLLHGFAMTPGYPKFYIGDFECHWNILAPEGIRVWITIVDISLRFDTICRDVLLIEDFGDNKILFNSCTEAIQPKGVVSTSNWVKVTVKTTSKFAYPKRGVLLHYTADGCVNPPLPANVKLVERTQTTAFYECQPSFIFPDSGLSSRKLTCNNIQVWDKLLPDCIEQENFNRGEVATEEKLTLISKKPDLSVITNRMSSQNDADIIFDIIIPSVLIAGLFIINGVVFTIIMKYRKRGKAIGDREMELAEL